MACWWRQFIIKKAKEAKDDKSIEPKRHCIDTISKKKSGPKKVPPRSSSSSSILASAIIICSKINVRRHLSSLPLLVLHPSSDNDLNSGISATSKLGSTTRVSKPRHVSKRKEPAIVAPPLSRNDNNSDDITIQSKAVNPLNQLAIHNGCLFPTSYTSPQGHGSDILTRTSKWKKGRFLGQGTFGQVFVGFNSDRGLMCAMKEVILCPDDPKSMESVKQLYQEVALLSNLQHPNIVRFYGCEMVGDKLYIYLEYAAGGSIYALLQQYGQLGESAIRYYTRQIVSGLEYLHAKRIVHRDIKGANILVDPNGTVKLAGFGMAKFISDHPSQLSLKESPHWITQEIVINQSDCNLSVDIWSLGCTILEMATTKPPCSQYETVGALYKVGNTEEIPEVPNYLSEEIKEFVNLCLQRDPESRPSAAQLLLHPFLQNFKLERSPIQLKDNGAGDKLDSYLHQSGNSSESSDMHSPRNIKCDSSSSLLGTSGSGAISFQNTI